MTGYEISGQILGFIGFALTFFSYQSKSPKTLLLLQTISTLLFICHYFLIGASSGMLLNIVCVLRNIVYYFRKKRIFSYRFYPYLFALLITVLCVLSWQGPISLLITVALAVNSVFLSFGNQRVLRISVLFTCSLILIYNIFVFSLGGILNESIAILSSALALLRYRKDQI